MSGAATRDSADASWFQRYLLPGFAFKAVVIGGGYATGRELAEFFLPSGPWGGLFAMLLATLICSVTCAMTFLFARVAHALDYRTFFRRLLGPFAILFELSYFPYIILLLAVFGAAAGAVGQALFGWPTLYGTLCLMAGMMYFTMFGNASVERLFKWVSVFLYATYAVFLVISLDKFGDRILMSFAGSAPDSGWAFGGITYAAYNVMAAVVILPTLRHFRSDADAVKAGLLAGPLAMVPAIVFFVCMCAFYPQVRDATLPSNFMLERMHLPLFQWMFQAMIFAALLESGTGSVHAINERIANAYRQRGRGELPNLARLAIAALTIIGSIFLASRFGLVTLIAKGYRLLAYTMLALYVVPLWTVGLWRLYGTFRARAEPEAVGTMPVGEPIVEVSSERP